MDWKKLAGGVLFPPLWLLVLLIALCTAALTAVFLQGWDTRWPACVVYALSFYTLCAAVAYCVRKLPRQCRQLKQRFLAHPLGGRYVTDGGFRTLISLYCALSVNLLYAGVNVLSWYLYRSWWFVCLAVYYGILSVMRFLLVRRLRSTELTRMAQLRRALSCFRIMLLLNLFLSGAVLMMVYQDRGYAYHGVMIYIMAMYTFYTIIHAIVGLIRYRSFHSPVLSAAKRISVAAALVSMLNLETAMFAQFGGEMSASDQQLFIILTGAGISITVITLSVLLIVKATKEIRSENHGT